MIELDPRQYPSEIATLLLLRGTGVPPLEWGEQQIRQARQTLDASDDVRLFAREALANEAMGAAVRSLLYAFNGWLSIGESRAQAAPVLEKAYLLSLCARQQGEPEAAKTFLQQIEEYPIYPPLAEFAIKTLAGHTEPLLKRFAGILEMGGTWEAFAFVDLYEQARAGKLSPLSYEAVAKIQFREFEMLFTQCFKAAVGDRPVVQTKEELDARKQAAAKRRTTRPKKQSQPTPTTTDSKKSSGKSEPAIMSAPVRVRCPKCKNITTLPGIFCGKTAQCIKCQSLFAVPHRKPAPIS